MVNFMQNITALAGSATLCRIFDFKNQVINLSGDFAANGTAIISYPETPGAPNEEWYIVPQAAAGTFTIESFVQPNFSISYAGVTEEPFGPSALHSQAIASSVFATVFRMESVGTSQQVK
ncbi:hypothetical protein C8F04DRAFT_1190370 [Mycena alexandri]|uniref:Uncharacterized protein n=1 Tax=Mycena alexandri TaxID=1745969 RepID=A0AAD6WTH2_9AGAR|nr:hypothetical protein C8F04DRAFT_1190370 [Mycena alexandri]